MFFKHSVKLISKFLQVSREVFVGVSSSKQINLEIWVDFDFKTCVMILKQVILLKTNMKEYCSLDMLNSISNLGVLVLKFY